MAKVLSNAQRFINAYNKIHAALKAQLNLKVSANYTEVIRKASKINSFVKKYEDKLIDYGRLRNSIVHSTDTKLVIAEPHTDVVEEYERICELLCKPPLALDSVANKVVSSIEYNKKVKDVIEYSYQSGFSNIPIFKEGMLIGVANGQKMLEVLGKKIYEKIDINKYISSTNIEEMMAEFGSNSYYTIASSKLTLDKVLDMFQENHKLLAIIITPSGTLLEKPVGIITQTDIINVNNILDNYTN